MKITCILLGRHAYRRVGIFGGWQCYRCGSRYRDELDKATDAIFAQAVERLAARGDGAE